MLIDNKRDYYSEAGLNLLTVWDFIQKNNGKETGKRGDRKFWSKPDAKTRDKISKLIGDERVQELFRD